MHIQTDVFLTHKVRRRWLWWVRKRRKGSLSSFSFLLVLCRAAHAISTPPPPFPCPHVRPTGWWWRPWCRKRHWKSELLLSYRCNCYLFCFPSQRKIDIGRRYIGRDWSTADVGGQKNGSDLFCVSCRSITLPLPTVFRAKLWKKNVIAAISSFVIEKKVAIKLQPFNWN